MEIKVHVGVGLALLFGLLPAASLAHPSIHDQLLLLDQSTAGKACDAHAELKRGDLYRAEKDWSRALQAYDRAALCDPHLDTVEFARGQLYLEKGDLRRARAALDLYLSRSPHSAVAILARGRTNLLAGHPEKAAIDFQNALAQIESPQPDHYVEWARALLAAKRAGEAIRCLDSGIARLGMVPLLEELAVDIEVSEGRVDAALQRLDRLPPPHEHWLLRRGQILEENGRRDEARAAFQAAAQLLTRRPIHRRNTPAVRRLESELHAALTRLADVSGAGAD